MSSQLVRMSSENQLSIIRDFERAIENCNSNGLNFRYTNDKPRKVSVIDWIKWITGKDNNQTRVILQRILGSNPEVETKMLRHVFSGQGQRATPVATACDLLYIMGKLPRKYIVSFERARDELTARYLGGDTSLVPEVRAIRAAQENLAELDPDNPMRIFGEAVESGQTGKYVDDRSEARAKSIEGYHEQVQAMRQNPALRSNGQSYVHTNAQVSRAALGMFPRELRKIVKVKSNVSSRNYMDANQLKAVALMTGIAANISTESKSSNEHKTRIEIMSDDFYDILKKYDVHGYKMVESLPRPLLLESAERE